MLLSVCCVVSLCGEVIGYAVFRVLRTCVSVRLLYVFADLGWDFDLCVASYLFLLLICLLIDVCWLFD